MHGLSAQAEDCDWRLSGFSPCIDAGANNPSSGAPLSSDLAGFPRIQGTAVDQGAYEFPIGTSTSNMQITPFSAFPFPNPCRESIRIEGQESMGAMDLRLYDPYGKEVLQRRVHPHETIHVSHLVAGTYLYRIGAAAGSSCTGKIIKH